MSTDSAQHNPNQRGSRTTPTAGEIQAWLVAHLAGVLEVDPGQIDVTAQFDSYGLDSAAAIGLTGDLESWLGYDLDPTLLYDYPTIEAVAAHLAQEAHMPDQQSQA
jgi:acyl carrier protein